MATELKVDPATVTPEEFARMLVGVNGDDIARLIRDAGTERVLDRIFEGMQERFRPERAQGVDAALQFVVADQGDQHPYRMVIRGGTCSVTKGRADAPPKATITTDLVSFVRLIVGQVEGPELFMTGKLKLSGDMVLSARTINFFDRPKV